MYEWHSPHSHSSKQIHKMLALKDRAPPRSEYPSPSRCFAVPQSPCPFSLPRVVFFPQRCNPVDSRETLSSRQGGCCLTEIRWRSSSGGCRCRDQPRPDKIQIHSCTTLSKPISSPTRDTHTHTALDTPQHPIPAFITVWWRRGQSTHTHTYTHTRSLSNPIQSCVVMDLPGVMSGQRWFTVVWTGTKTRPLMFSQPNTTHRFTILAVPLLNMHTVLFFQTATKLSTRLSALNKCTGCTWLSWRTP